MNKIETWIMGVTDDDEGPIFVIDSIQVIKNVDILICELANIIFLQMNALSDYIQQQLCSLMQQIENTPPKKYSSLAKIKQLVKSAHLPEMDRRTISKSIKKVETAIITYCTPSKVKMKSSRSFIDGSIDKLSSNIYQSDKKGGLGIGTKIQKTLKNEKHISQLMRYYGELRSNREEMDKQLQKLIIKVQRLQRLKRRKVSQQQKQIQQKTLAKQYRDKSHSLCKIKQQTIEAVQKNRKDMVQKLMKKFYDGVN